MAIDKLDLDALQTIEVEPGVFRQDTLYRHEVMLAALVKLNEVIDKINVEHP